MLQDVHEEIISVLAFDSRDIALEVLRNEPIGSFIVRESTTKTGCFALSLRVPKEFKRLGIAHYLILKSGRGYKIKVRCILKSEFV